MPKLKGKATVENSLPRDTDAWTGSWGRINLAPQSVQTLRLCKGPSSSYEESYSYPYRTLSAWTWRRTGQKEELKIEAGPDEITITGRGLGRLVEALDVGSLELVVERISNSPTHLENAIVVESLVIEKVN